MNRYLKTGLGGVAFLGVVLVSLIVWFISLLDQNSVPEPLRQTKPGELEYLSRSVSENRGKILAVVSSAPYFLLHEKFAGYEFTELSRAYYVFKTNGFKVEITSPLGGKAPARKDWEDFGEFDYAFLNDPEAKQLIENTLPINKVDVSAYDAVYFVGGKGAMYDFVDNPHIQEIVRTYIESGKIVSAVCHGPVALANVKLSDNSMAVAGRSITSISNQEELFNVPDANKQFSFLLETRLREQGGQFSSGPMYLDHVVVDDNLITGQNPWSVWSVAEAVVKKLGYEPIERNATADENSIDILLTLEKNGYSAALASLNQLLLQQQKAVNRDLIAIHTIIALWGMDIRKALDILRLTQATKSLQKKS